MARSGRPGSGCWRARVTVVVVAFPATAATSPGLAPTAAPGGQTAGSRGALFSSFPQAIFVSAEVSSGARPTGRSTTPWSASTSPSPSPLLSRSRGLTALTHRQPLRAA